MKAKVKKRRKGIDKRIAKCLQRKNLSLSKVRKICYFLGRAKEVNDAIPSTSAEDIEMRAAACDDDTGGEGGQKDSTAQ